MVFMDTLKLSFSEYENEASTTRELHSAENTLKNDGDNSMRSQHITAKSDDHEKSKSKK